MLWDDELDWLTTTVVEHFGKDAFSSAVSRAFSKASRQLMPAPAGSLIHEVSDGEAQVLPHGAYEEALRVELRALLRPH